MFLSLTLDTTPPVASLALEGSAAFTPVREIVATLATEAADIAQMRVWGDVDPSYDANVQPLEADSQWVAHTESFPLRLSTGNGPKTVYATVRDDVYNASLPISATITYDDAIPVVTVTTALDRARVSKVSGYDVATFAWQANVPFDMWRVKVVPSAISPFDGGVTIGETFGSTNTNEDDVSHPADTPILTTINAADLEAAHPGDTQKIVKVFVRALDGTWSV